MPGKQSAHCGGRSFSGPDKGGFYCTFCMLSVPFIICLAIVVPTIVRDSKDSLASQLAAVILGSLFGLLGVAAIGSLVRASFSDPGVLPRGTTTEDAPREVSVGVEGATPGSPPMKLPLKWCHTCCIHRSPRAVHCSICDCCVESFDHHCPWIGNCVGKRNYRYFATFAFCTTGSIVLGFVLSLWNVILVGQRDGDGVILALFAAPVAAALTVYAFIQFWSVGMLSFYHGSLITRGLTTNEEMKYNRFNPFSRGACQNWRAALCGPVYPSFTAHLRRAAAAHDDTTRRHRKPYDDSHSTPSDEVPLRDSVQGV